MTDNLLLNVTIGLVLMYLLIALFCTIFQEWIATLLDWRAKHLEAAIKQLLSPSATPSTEATAVLNHPLIRMVGRSMPAATNAGGAETATPSFLPARNFAQALINVLEPGRDANGAIDLAGLRTKVNAISGNDDLKKALNTVLDTAGDKVTDVVAGIETWFDSAMERASGWYKRMVTKYLFAIGLGMAVIFNADTIQVAVLLSKNAEMARLVADYAATVAPPDLAEGKVKEAFAKYQEDVADRLAKGATLGSFGGLPVGWDYCISKTKKEWDLTACYGARRDDFLGSCGWAFLAKILGLLLTASMAALGGPFWFEILQKLNAIRGTGPKPTAAEPKT